LLWWLTFLWGKEENTNNPASTLLFFGCASSNSSLLVTETQKSFVSSDLDCCNDFSNQVINLKTNTDIIVLVHGCKASSKHFTTLKEVFASRGQQAICFSYNYRDSIEECSGKLIEAINSVNDLINPPTITIIGHSQGGLVARRALIHDRSDARALSFPDTKIRLVTISSPFNGIKASSHCGIPALHIASVGTTVVICQAIAGSTWSEIHPSSDFINNPGQMSVNVSTHLKINTDEDNICRTQDAQGNCMEDDFVFGLDEQYSSVIDNDTRVSNIELKAGHARVIGSSGRPPFELIETLESTSIMKKQTTLIYAENLALLERLYQ